MDNPWIRLPQSPPFVLQEDRTAIDRFNARATELHQIHLELIPEPFLGRPDAPIVLLNLNPGFDPDDTRFHQSDPYFIEQSRKNLLHSPIRYPFYLLNPKLSQSLGHQWWRRKLKAPIAIAGVDKVASRVLCIDQVRGYPYGDFASRFALTRGLGEHHQGQREKDGACRSFFVNVPFFT